MSQNETGFDPTTGSVSTREFGPSSDFDPTTVQPGDELPPLTLNPTRATAVRYAGASTDFNPIHWSDRKARELGFDGVLIHGMWTMGAAAMILTDWAGPQRLVDYQVRFTNPVPLPDDDAGITVQVTASVTAVEDALATVAITAVIPGGEKPVKVLGMAKAHINLEA